MERVTKQGLGEGREFPCAHVSRQEQDSFAARLGCGKILKSVEQHEALDILFRVARKMGELRAHPAELLHHAAYGRLALLLAPIRECPDLGAPSPRGAILAAPTAGMPPCARRQISRVAEALRQSS